MSEAGHPNPLRILQERPEESAYQTLTAGQRWFLLAAGLALLAAVIISPVGTLRTVNAAIICAWAAHVLYKLWLVYLSLGRGAEVEVTEDEIERARRRGLPSYAVLVPLYREAKVLPELVQALSSMDYPQDRYTVYLLLEEDDAETIAAVERLDLPDNFKPIIVPDSKPKTKPKACNYALELIDSDLLVIYDAEDRPDPDQLIKAAAAFSKLPDDVICLQARLNYYNAHQNVLARLFTVEYAAWFDLFLPGLTALGGPIPLGGTSNHFRTRALKDLGGWDPFNVTEDCDLGVRMYVHGYKAAMIRSTTWEEANCRLRGWIRQRSRWAKGYVQTYLVYMRSPLRTLRRLGFMGFVNFQAMIGGSIFSYLFTPLYWLLTALWLALHPALIEQVFAPLWVYELGVACLFLGNFAFVYLSAAAVAARGMWDLVGWSLLSPAYWLLMSVGAYKGIGQLAVQPFYWEKTEHGLSKT